MTWQQEGRADPAGN